MTQQTLEAVDLSAFLPVDTAVLEILTPGGKQTGWKITFAGPGHPKTAAWTDEKARETLQRNRQIEMAQINGRKYKPEETSVDEARRNNVRWIAARILDWTPVTLQPGAPPIAFSEEAAVKLFVDPKLVWVYSQCLDFLTAEQSFTQASAKI